MVAASGFQNVEFYTGCRQTHTRTQSAAKTQRSRQRGSGVGSAGARAWVVGACTQERPLGVALLKLASDLRQGGRGGRGAAQRIQGTQAGLSLNPENTTL